MAGHIIRGSGERQGPRLRLIDEWINSDRTWCHPSAAEENMEASLCSVIKLQENRSDPSKNKSKHLDLKDVI